MPRIAIAQINSTVGDLQGNSDKILAALEKLQKDAPDIIVFPELTLTGYPPEDLLLKPRFLEACEKAMKELVAKVKQPCLIGYPRRAEDGNLYNSAAYVCDGKIISIYNKHLLPNYSVFDEERYFAHGTEGMVLDIKGTKCGVVICEDAWEEEGPAKKEAAAGAEIILCLSASPFHRSKGYLRHETFAPLCRNNKVWFVYSNLVGGQDELVFDGGSLVMDPNGNILAQGLEFEETLMVFEIDGTSFTARDGCEAIKKDEDAEVYEALVLGLRDYVRKNGFSGVVIGLSGGIDSALTAAIAVDALGSENVIGVTMPSQYSSGETISDAEILARNMNIRFETLPIAEPHAAFSKNLAPLFEGVDTDKENLTDQNLQARIRAVYLMAVSNKFGMLVINTSNKSESAVGYGTLYGDMVGAYAAIKDVFKTKVWELSYYANKRHGREFIPVSTIERVPTAELRPDQEDRQSIPDYPILDPILELYIEQDMTYSEIVEAGHDPEITRKVVTLVDRNEFKRRQSVMGTRVTTKGFGKDRRLPITNRFRQW